MRIMMHKRRGERERERESGAVPKHTEQVIHEPLLQKALSTSDNMTPNSHVFHKKALTDDAHTKTH